jgi:hypothetical protein
MQCHDYNFGKNADLGSKLPLQNPNIDSQDLAERGQNAEAEEGG